MESRAAGEWSTAAVLACIAVTVMMAGAWRWTERGAAAAANPASGPAGDVTASRMDRAAVERAGAAVLSRSPTAIHWQAEMLSRGESVGYEQAVLPRRYEVQYACASVTAIELGTAVSGIGGEWRAVECAPDIRALAVSADEGRLGVQLRYHGDEPMLVALQVVPE
jgi:hypothetical protein